MVIALSDTDTLDLEKNRKPVNSKRAIIEARGQVLKHLHNFMVSDCG